MDIDRFMQLIENTYGKYDSNLKTVVIQFLNKSIQKEMIGKVYVSIIYYHKVNFGVPCIATIRECIKNGIDDKEIPYPYIVKKGTSTDRYNYMEDYLNGDEDLKPIGSLVSELAKKVGKK